MFLSHHFYMTLHPHLRKILHYSETNTVHVNCKFCFQNYMLIITNIKFKSLTVQCSSLEYLKAYNYRNIITVITHGSMPQ